VQIYCGVSWELIMRVGTSPLSLLQRAVGPSVWDTRFATGVVNSTYLGVLVSRLPVGFMRIAGLRDGFRQKFLGTAPLHNSSSRVIWIHAVSLGEMLMVTPLIGRLVTQRPDLQFVLSSRTREGYQVAQQRFPDLPVFYAPFDFSWAVTRAFDRLQPSALIIVEQDLWMNMLLVAARRGVPIAVVNGRMDPDDRRHLRRYNPLPTETFAKIRIWTVTSPESIDGVRDVTGPEFANFEVAGFLKADASAFPASGQGSSPELKRLYGFGEDEKILVAGSTHYPEEAFILQAFQALSVHRPELKLRLVLVPRHEPFRIVEQLLIDRGAHFIKRSQIDDPLKESFPVTLVDRFGELPALWKIADFGFVGGSLKPKWGGHNLLEPAAAGVPTCIGPHVSTFRDVSQALLKAGGAIQVTNAGDIERVLGRWLDDPAEARRIGSRARSFVRSHQGATEKTITALDRILPAARGTLN
jgi:3-deoxy-D-manno-octulosonic-acid transferase